jgi:hypothetical protein
MERSEGYRKELTLCTEAVYTWVRLGPIPDSPDWHIQSEATQYPFPTDEAAQRFARNHVMDGRDITVVYPDGREWEL